jgi:hypothetical protein
MIDTLSDLADIFIPAATVAFVALVLILTYGLIAKAIARR